MTVEENTVGLSASEEAYFSSRGEAELPAVEEEAPVTTEVATEAAVDSIVPAQERDDKGKFVPHGALHAEREEHKKTREEQRRVAERLAVFEDRWNTLLQASKAEPVAEVAAPPDPNEDIFAYSKWQADRIASLDAKVTARETAEQQAKQQTEQEQAIWNHWNQSIEAIKADAPDFGDAAKHLLDLRTNQLKAIGLDKAAIDKTIDAEVKGLVIQAVNNNQSPAQVAYEYAKASGYTGPKPVDTPPAPVNGALPDKLAGIQAAQSASRSVAASAGGGAPDPDSTEALLAMSETDFAKWLEKGNFKRVMGG